MPPTAEELALLDVDTVLHRAADRLADKYTGIFSPETVDRVVNESYVALYRTARIHRHLTALAEHFAGDRLAAWPTPRAPSPARSHRCCSCAWPTRAAPK